MAELSELYETIYSTPDGRLCLVAFSNETGEFGPVRDGDGNIQVGYLVDGEPVSADDTEFAWVDPAKLEPQGRLDGNDVLATVIDMTTRKKRP